MAARRLVLMAVALLSLTLTAAAEEFRYFRIGTGGIAGTYYPIGGLIADIISSPPGARPCHEGGSCGVAGLVAVAQSSNGSVANIDGLRAGELESGFVQSDLAYFAYTGTGPFAGRKAGNLRAIANLYPESVHLVARKDAGISSVHELKGKRVALDEPGSGTLVDARLILAAYGLTERDLIADYIKPSPAVARIRDGSLDAYFTIAGYPNASVVDLADSGEATLIPIDGPEADRLIGDYPFFSRDVIPADTYLGLGETRTISVNAQWLVRAELDDDLIYGVTAALWSESARVLLDNGHRRARTITLATALDDLAVPLHPGAERYYRERGLVN
jgi:hypothetical protein